MISRKTIKYLYHLLIKRDIVGPIGLKKYGHVGDNTMLYKPCITDRNKNLISIGSGTTILLGSRFQLFPDYNERSPAIIIGNNCYIGYNNSFLAGGKIIIEDGVLMASNILITSENHSMNPEDAKYYMDQPLICLDIRIGEGGWIGEKACILPGVNIGKKCIIAAASVVTHDIPDYSVAAGVPARVIKTYSFKFHKWISVNN